MSAPVAEAARTAPRSGPTSRQAARLFADLMAAPKELRREYRASLSRRDMEQLVLISLREGGTPFAMFVDDPVGFVEDVLGESLWSIPQRIAEAIPSHRRIAVPSCFASSKTWSLARIALWFANVHPVGTARIVTIAPQWRQVSGLMWPEIRSAHTRGGLPGEVGEVQLKMARPDGSMYKVAEGIVGNPRNEASTQGIHSPNLLLLVDEAGGIPHGVGNNLRALLTGDGTHMVAIGNPPSDDEGSWFEKFSERDDTLTIPISAYSTPNFTGEQAKRCRSCPPEVPAHTLAKHLVGPDWVEDALKDFGADSPYIAAKVKATFPKGGSPRAIPSTWLEQAKNAPEPVGQDGYVRLCDLGLEEEDRQWLVPQAAWVRLGVDVAADGGDELVVARIAGDLVTEEHISSGSANANPMDVAGVVLKHILRAQALAKALGTQAKVRVKIDGIGIGWGVAGILESWGEEGLHDAEIVSVVVSESPDKMDHEAPTASATMRPYRKRDEMWLATRSLVQPIKRPDEQDLIGWGQLRMRVSDRTIGQLAAPAIGTNSQGFTIVESKKSLKARGLNSPDRAEAVLLAPYEPTPAAPKRKKARLLV